ncbi:MAG: hypothetical protein MJ217_00850 [Bacilli bacterium]|nr:hypothetical protein [Bacilli bacterium]
MKTKILPLLAIASALLISGCHTKKPNSSINSDPSSQESSSIIDSSVDPISSSSINPSVVPSSNPSTTSVTPSSSTTSSTTPIDDEQYLIRVNKSTGVSYLLSKARAKANETVTIQLTFDAGYKLKEITSNQTKLTKVNDNLFSFVMPNKPVTINITVDIEGDVTLSGGVAAALTYDSAKGYYVAKDVAVTGTSKYVNFDLIVQGNKADALDLDESRCFADVNSGYPSAYEFSIATGCTYDFIYEPSSEVPFYVIRKSVDVFPTDTNGIASLIESLFSGKMRSESACHPVDLVGIDYTFDSADLKYDYHYTLYENNVSYAYVNDKTVDGQVNMYYVYKKADLNNGMYTVVNTYPKNKGNNESDYYLFATDPYRADGSYCQNPFSAKLAITGEETDSRYEISKREALRDVRAGAHYGAALEYEFWDSYRDLYDGTVVINAPENWDLKIKLTNNGNDGFQAEVNSYLEYDHAGGSGTADAEMHEGQTSVLKMGFLKNGALKTLDATISNFDKNQWDFKNHKAKTGEVGTVKHFTVSNTFGNPKTGSTKFDPSIYFIQNISAFAWNNAETKQTSTNTTSYVNFNDLLEIYPYGEGGKKSKLVSKFDYTPSTALDMWQYGVVSSDNAEVIGLNGQRVYQAIGVGESNVKIANRASETFGPKYNVKVVSSANGKHHGFYVDAYTMGYDSYGAERSDTITGYAGKTMKYRIETSSYNTGAPCTYTVCFRSEAKVRNNWEWYDTSDYMTVLSTGHDLIIDFNTTKSMALTSMKTLVIGLDCDFYEDDIWYTELTINLHPYKEDVVLKGTRWIYNSYIDPETKLPLNDYTTVEFTDEVYSASDNAYKGVITDYNEISATETYLNKWYFWYIVNEKTGQITADIYSCNVENPDFTNDSYDYYLMFGGLSEDNLLKVALMWFHADVSYSDYADILGYTVVDDEGHIIVDSYQGFTLVK